MFSETHISLSYGESYVLDSPNLFLDIFLESGCRPASPLSLLGTWRAFTRIHEVGPVVIRALFSRLWGLLDLGQRFQIVTHLFFVCWNEVAPWRGLYLLPSFHQRQLASSSDKRSIFVCHEVRVSPLIPLTVSWHHCVYIDVTIVFKRFFELFLFVRKHVPLHLQTFHLDRCSWFLVTYFAA